MFTLADIEGEIVGLVAVTGSFLIALVWIVAATVDSLFKTRQREQTKREVAAYVAEGTISPDDAARIIEAGKRKPGETG